MDFYILYLIVVVQVKYICPVFCTAVAVSLGLIADDADSVSVSTEVYGEEGTDFGDLRILEVRMLCEDRRFQGGDLVLIAEVYESHIDSIEFLEELVETLTHELIHFGEGSDLLLDSQFSILR